MDSILTTDEFILKSGTTFNTDDTNVECFVGGKAIFIALDDKNSKEVSAILDFLTTQNVRNLNFLLN